MAIMRSEVILIIGWRSLHPLLEQRAELIAAVVVSLSSLGIAAIGAGDNLLSLGELLYVVGVIEADLLEVVFVDVLVLRDRDALLVHGPDLAFWHASEADSIKLLGSLLCQALW